MTDYEKFKELLKLFVSHLESIQSGKDSITPLNKKCNALKTDFSETKYGNILVNVSNQFNNGYTTKTCYLEWERGSGVNVNCVWNNSKNKIEKLQLQQCINGGQSQGQFEDPKMRVSVSDLDLFSTNQPNSALKIFFDNYCKMYKPQLSENMNIVNLLESSKNLILTGAPGVGKTYKTVEIAVAIIDGADKVPANRSDLMKRYKELINSGQIAFTTFHQSLDYEEFVEGLKPDIDDDDNSTGIFSVKNGIFKAICEDATVNFDDSKKTQEQFNEESRLKNFVEDFLNDAIENNKEFKTTFWRIKYYIEEFEKEKIKIRHGNYNDVKEKPKNEYVTIDFKELIVILQNKEKFADKKTVVEALKRKIIHPLDNYFYSIYLEIFDALQQNKSQKNANIQSITLQNFVLIIDEINRGNNSKIFGELITLLEKDKRFGEENEITITLPYSQDKFGIPPNLYIIGTMNTADRSIGTIDYALRRRFAFFSLKADKNVISSYDKYQNDVKEKAENLFQAIETFMKSEDNINPDLDAEDLMIGHSYFLCETEDELKRRLEYEIIPLLWEYQKDGILTCDRKTLNGKVMKWLNFVFSEQASAQAVETGTSDDGE